MTIMVITEAQKLIREVGGEFRAGDKLKHYWMTVCENLSQYTDTWVQPRTIEVFWREGRGGAALISALKTAAARQKEDQRKRVKEHDAKFIGELRASYEALKKDPLYPKYEIALLGATIRCLEAIAKQRFIFSQRFADEDSALDLLKSCCRISRAIIREEAAEAAE